MKQPVEVGRLVMAGMTRPKAVLFHLQSMTIAGTLMIGINEMVSGTKSVEDAMTAAARDRFLHPFHRIFRQGPYPADCWETSPARRDRCSNAARLVPPGYV